MDFDLRWGVSVFHGLLVVTVIMIDEGKKKTADGLWKFVCHWKVQWNVLLWIKQNKGQKRLTKDDTNHFSFRRGSCCRDSSWNLLREVPKTLRFCGRDLFRTTKHGTHVQSEKPNPYWNSMMIGFSRFCTLYEGGKFQLLFLPNFIHKIVLQKQRLNRQRKKAIQLK